MKKPNVLFIMTDQQRWDTLGSIGGGVIETPNLDWLAAEGTRFTNAYTPCPSCIPARASLLTGMNPWNTGILGMGPGQPPMGTGFAHTMPGELAQAGYHAQAVGITSFHPRHALNGFHHIVLDDESDMAAKDWDSGYKQWFNANKTGDYGPADHGIRYSSWMSRPYHAPEYLHPTNWTVNESIRCLNQRDPSKPFFLKTSFVRPHSPYDPPAYYFDMYWRDKQLPKPSVGDWAKMHDVPADAAHPEAWRGVRSDEEIRRARAGYYGCITHVDHQIGRLLYHMSRNGLLDETLVIFTSDHGDMLGDHNLWRKTYAYEGSAHIPLLVRLPKSMRSGKRDVVEEPVQLQDIMPTVLDVLGLDIPNTVDGASLYGLIRGDRTGWREFVHGEHSPCYSMEQEMQYLTDGRHKYIWFPRLGTEQLFNLQDDPGECHDLSDRADCQEELLKWRLRLIDLLEPRNCGLTDGRELLCQTGKPIMVSPKYAERLAASDYDWTKSDA